MASEDQFRNDDNEVDQAKRDTLAHLAKSGWVVPVVATFGLAQLGMSSSAFGSNGTSS